MQCIANFWYKFLFIKNCWFLILYCPPFNSVDFFSEMTHNMWRTLNRIIFLRKSLLCYMHRLFRVHHIDIDIDPLASNWLLIFIILQVIYLIRWQFSLYYFWWNLLYMWSLSCNHWYNSFCTTLRQIAGLVVANNIHVMTQYHGKSVRDQSLLVAIGRKTL